MRDNVEEKISITMEDAEDFEADEIDSATRWIPVALVLAVNDCRTADAEQCS